MTSPGIHANEYYQKYELKARAPEDPLDFRPADDIDYAQAKEVPLIDAPFRKIPLYSNSARGLFPGRVNENDGRRR